MTTVLDRCSELICGMLLPALLFTCGVFFFVRLGRYFFDPRFYIKGISGGEKGTLSSLWLALGGTLGVGNICGVAAAIYVGGAGCIFWIWICAILSALTKYSETVLAVHYREKTDRYCHGGPHLYIENGLGSKSLSKVFCLLCIFTAFTMGNVTQVKVAADFARTSVGIPTIFCAALFFIAVFILSSGKGKRISAFTSKAVPILCVIYTVLCLAVIIKYRLGIPNLTNRIISEAFTVKAGSGGIIGVLCSPALRLGITRGVMSNEAGCGTAPIAYAAEPDALPVKSGLLGACEVIVDTLLLCTLTAYALLLPQTDLSPSSASSVIDAFSFAISKHIAPILALSVFLFALASVAAWAFYATEAASHLQAPNRVLSLFPVAYSLTAFFGCYINENTVWALADISVACMGIVNVIALLLMHNKVKSITRACILQKSNASLENGK